MRDICVSDVCISCLIAPPNIHVPPLSLKLFLLREWPLRARHVGTAISLCSCAREGCPCMVPLDHWTAGGLHLLSGLVIEGLRPRQVSEPAACNCHCHVATNGTGCDPLERLLREEIRRVPAGGLSWPTALWVVGLAALLSLACGVVGCGLGVLAGRRSSTAPSPAVPAARIASTTPSTPSSARALENLIDKDLAIVTEAITPANRKARHGADVGRA